jgi:hypothetical protein
MVTSASSLASFFFMTRIYSFNMRKQFSVDDGHLPMSSAVITPRHNNGFHWSSTQGKGIKLISCIHYVCHCLHFDTGSHFLHLCSANADIFIHNSYLPSLLDSIFVIGRFDGDVVSEPPMNQKVLGFSQQRMIPTMAWKMWWKLLSLLTQADEASQAFQASQASHASHASQASQTKSLGQN